MNRVITNEMIAAQDEDAIRRLEARYEADPTIFDQYSSSPDRPERAAGAFALLRRLANAGTDLDDVRWETEGPHVGNTYEDREESYRSYFVGRITIGPDILATMRRLLLEEIKEFANQEAADCRLAHAIDRQRSIHG